MSQNPQDNSRTMMYLLGVVVVLLVVIVGIVFARTQSSTPVATTPGVTAPTGGTQAPAGGSMPGVGSSQANFDVKTATKVESGTDPKAFVQKYYQAILDKKWDVAFKMQPAASQANGTVKDFEQTQISYGMKSFKINSSNVQGDTATVVVEQDLGTNGIWGATWTFVKNGSDWLVKERKVSMGGGN